MKKSGFSLVELLVTLIIVSLVMSAFAPVITKKLSASGITVGAVVQGGSGTGDGDDNDGDKKEPEDTTCDAGPSEECCKKLGAKFLSEDQIGKNLCFSQFNAGDNYVKQKDGSWYHPEYAKIGVSMVDSGAKCSTDSCCWRRASSGTEVEAYKNYKAANRTLCEKAAGQKICAEWAPPGSLKGSWRLPTATELAALAPLINAETDGNGVITRYLNETGLQFCDYSSTDKGSNKCPNSATCNGANANSSGNNCYPHNIMSQGSSYSLSGGKFIAADTTNYAKSVRCVTEAPKVTNILDEHTPASNEPTEKDCTDMGTIFISAKFTGSSNLCMFKYNAGEISPTAHSVDEFSHKYGIQLLPGGSKCNLSSTGMCCWYNGTGSGSNGTFKYSGLDRILCMKKAGEAICNNYNKKKGKWRLPTEAELKSLAPYITAETNHSAFLSKHMGENGLQLCDYHSAAYGADKCGNTAKCSGATANSSSNNCYPHYVMSQGASYSLDYGAFVIGDATNYARSVRCVTDDILGKPAEEERTPEPNEPTEQDCESMGTVFVSSKYTKSKNLCMFRYNAGDKDTTTHEVSLFAGTYGVQVHSGAKTCNLKSTGMCCWLTGTGGHAGSYDYSGANRTLCMKKAGETICNNYTAKKGLWRLPTEDELKNMAPWITASTSASPFLSKYLDTGGLQLCDWHSSAYGGNQCANMPTCKGATANSSDNNCYPHYVMSQGKSYSLDTGAFVVGDATNYARSVRCVADDMTQRELGSVDPSSDEPQKQEDCPADSVFISNKYTTNTGLCMLRFNAGDGNTKTVHPNILSGIVPKEAGENCTGDACCWRLNTGSITSPEKFSYSGANRTLCNKATGERICANLGEHWRLPTELELKNIGPWITASSDTSPSLSKFMDDNNSELPTGGLQFCDYHSAAYGANMCGNKPTCKGATANSSGNNCYPHYIMSAGKSYSLDEGAFVEGDATNYARSVRCVTDKAVH